MRILVISDTHIPDFARWLPAALEPELDRADLILHAGDVTGTALLDELRTHAPTEVALGNGDGEDVRAWGARREVHLDLEGVRVAMLHDSGPTRNRELRMRRRFPDADLIVFGHSHIPIDLEHDGVRFLNPGSPTWKRREPFATYAVAEIADGSVHTRLVRLQPEQPSRERPRGAG